MLQAYDLATTMTETLAALKELTEPKVFRKLVWENGHKLLRVPAKHLEGRASGINHFTFFTELRTANWWWALLGLGVSALTYLGAALSLWACADRGINGMFGSPGADARPSQSPRKRRKRRRKRRQ